MPGPQLATLAIAAQDIAGNGTEEQKEKYDDLVKNLLDQGYQDYSADVVLKYAANNLWKD